MSICSVPATAPHCGSEVAFDARAGNRISDTGALESTSKVKLRRSVHRSIVTVKVDAVVSKEFGQSKYTGKMFGSEGSHGQASKHRRLCVSVADQGAPSCDTVMYKCTCYAWQLRA